MVEVPTWLEGDGVHMAVPADLLPPEALGRLTEMWQAEIRKSPLIARRVRRRKASQVSS